MLEPIIAGNPWLAAAAPADVGHIVEWVQYPGFGGPFEIAEGGVDFRS